jgi:hypothetical protein
MAFSQKLVGKVPEEETGFCDGRHGTVTKSRIRWFSDFVMLGAKHSSHQLRQLADVRRDPSCLVLAEWLCCRSTTGFAFIIDAGEPLTVRISTMKQFGVTSADQGGGKRRGDLTLRSSRRR